MQKATYVVLVVICDLCFACWFLTAVMLNVLRTVLRVPCCSSPSRFLACAPQKSLGRAPESLLNSRRKADTGKNYKKEWKYRGKGSIKDHFRFKRQPFNWSKDLYCVVIWLVTACIDVLILVSNMQHIYKHMNKSCAPGYSLNVYESLLC